MKVEKIKTLVEPICSECSSNHAVESAAVARRDPADTAWLLANGHPLPACCGVL